MTDPAPDATADPFRGASTEADEVLGASTDTIAGAVTAAAVNAAMHVPADLLAAGAAAI